jgi:calcineurin-like phosphoesterase family protein
MTPSHPSSPSGPVLPRDTILGVLETMSEHGEAAIDDATLDGTGADPVERAMFLAGLNAALDEASQDPARERSVLFAPDNAFLSQLQGLAQERAEAAWAAGRLRDPIVDLGQFREVVYDDRDLGGWIRSFFRWKRFGRHRFDEPPDPSVIAIPDDARIALFGDWGSGRYGAPVIGDTLRRDPQPIHAAIHLGDVYYCGLASEVTRNLLGPWPFRDGMRSFTLNGNHEMYGGGHGLWAAMQRFAQPYTYFALQNAHFTILGLDSAVDDGDLFGRQADWIGHVIEAAGGRRVILLSHHQPYSIFDPDYGAMVDRLRPWLTAGRIAAWYWGHEHRCVVFDPDPRWGGMQGRCIGHGGYPYFRDPPRAHWSQDTGGSDSFWYRFPANEGGRDAPGGRVLVDGNRHVRDERGGSLEMRYGAHGYAMLHLAGGACTERLHRPDGAPIFTRAL